MGFLRRYVFHNIGLKLFSLVMAVCLWAVVTQDRLEARKTRAVEVRPRVVGRLASGFAITGVMADPARVEVTGPAKRVDMVDSATTDPVDATGLLSQHTFTTSAYVSDPHVHVVNPQSVRVTVFVGKSSGGSD
jgi:YbbR domain-containing protein